MIKFYNECIDSADWIEEITGYRPADNVITLEELDEIAKNLQLMVDLIMNFLIIGIIIL